MACVGCSDMSTFFEDIRVCRPTSMMIIPRIANMLFDQAQEQIRKAKDENKQVLLFPPHWHPCASVLYASSVSHHRPSPSAARVIPGASR